MHLIPQSSPVADIERAIPANAAVAAAFETANVLGLTIRTEVVADGSDSGAQVVYASLVNRDGEIVDRGSGKGIGRHALASAVYEAFEHAAARGQLPGQTIEVTNAVLPEPPFRQTDLLYKYAMERRAGRPQPVMTFYRHTIPLAASFDDPVAFPRIPVDMSYRIQEADADLLYLDRSCTTNGYAAGTSIHDALTHAINEIIERDAFSEHLLEEYLSAEPRTVIAPPYPVHIEDVIKYLEGQCGSKVRVVLMPAQAGTVVMAWTRTADGAFIEGWGCSSHLSVSVERATTELLQEFVALRAGHSFADEGGEKISLLGAYPAMERIARRFPPRHDRTVAYSKLEAEFNRIRPSSLRAGLVDDLKKTYDVFWRPVWHGPSTGSAETDVNVVVVQALVPGLEHFGSILFGRPTLPVARLHSKELAAVLIAREQG